MAPQGLLSYGPNERWANDGFYYLGRRKIAPYMVIQRFSGWDILVRHAELDNIHRFEEKRWNLLVRVERYRAREAKVARELATKIGVRGGRKITTLVNDKWYWVRVDKTRVWYEDMAAIDNDKILDEIVARTSASSRITRLAYLCTLYQMRIENYMVKARRFEAAMFSLMRDKVPDKDGLWRPSPALAFIINGRRYSFIVNEQQVVKHWPTPTQQIICLDAEMNCGV